MGFLDKKDRIVDLVLTERGRQLYSMGTLEFTYFAVFDDGLDYDPVPSTGSYTDADRQAQMETVLVLEAPYVRARRSTAAGLFEPTSHLFTAADGFKVVPRIATPTTGSISVSCDQYPGDTIGGRFVRKSSTRSVLAPTLDGDVETDARGFTVRVFVSGAAGLEQLFPKFDTALRRAFDPFIAADVDDEAPSDAPDHGDPRSFRR